MLACELHPGARVACETLLADQCVVVAGEFKTATREVADSDEAGHAFQ